MRTFKWFIVAGFVLLGAASAGATEIGLVDVDRVVGNVEQGQEAIRLLNDWAEPRQQFMDVLVLEASLFREQLDKQAGAAKPEVIEQLQMQLRDKGREYEDEQRKFTRSFEAKQDELLRVVGQRLDKIIEEYAKQRKLDAVFALKDMPIVFVSDSVDVTDELIRIYNLRHPQE